MCRSPASGQPAPVRSRLTQCAKGSAPFLVDSSPEDQDAIPPVPVALHLKCTLLTLFSFNGDYIRDLIFLYNLHGRMKNSSGNKQHIILEKLCSLKNLVNVFCILEKPSELLSYLSTMLR